MSLREKTISGAKWSAIATVIIIGLGLVQMTVLARIIDNHQFGLLTVSLVIIALADTLSDFGIANSIIQRKEISHLELTTLYWLNVGLGIVVCVAVFLLSDAIGDVLNNPDLAPLIKTLSLSSFGSITTNASGSFFIVAGVCGDPPRATVPRVDAKGTGVQQNRHDRNQRGAGGLHFYGG